jgi:hypothetical protein
MFNEVVIKEIDARTEASVDEFIKGGEKRRPNI